MLELKNIYFKYNKKSDYLFKNINITCASHEKIAIIAPTGYGKSTLAKIASGYILPNYGEVLWKEKKLLSDSYSPIQLIHQHPELSLNPKLTIKKSLHESDIIDDFELLNSLGIKKEWLNRYPKELSGGELQRVAIARALNNKTEFLIADEITSMLDMISQVSVWKFLINILNERNIGLMMIAHDINLAEKISDRTVFLQNIINN